MRKKKKENRKPFLCQQMFVQRWNLRTNVFIKFYKLSDSMTILGITYVF